MGQELVATASAIAIIAGVVEVIKRGFGTPCKLTPVMSLLLGVAISLFYVMTETYTARTFADAVLQGVVNGLASSGLFSQTKTYIPAIGRDHVEASR